MRHPAGYARLAPTITLPKQLPRWGSSVSQAELIRDSPLMIVLITASSILITRPDKQKSQKKQCIQCQHVITILIHRMLFCSGEAYSVMLVNAPLLPPSFFFTSIRARIVLRVKTMFGRKSFFPKWIQKSSSCCTSKGTSWVGGRVVRVSWERKRSSQRWQYVCLLSRKSLNYQWLTLFCWRSTMSAFFLGGG